MCNESFVVRIPRSNNKPNTHKITLNKMLRSRRKLLRALERLAIVEEDVVRDEGDDVDWWVAGKSKVKDDPSRSRFKVADHL